MSSYTCEILDCKQYNSLQFFDPKFVFKYDRNTVVHILKKESSSPLSNYSFIVSLTSCFKNQRKLDNFNLRVL